jgi:hypothetical protein
MMLNAARQGTTATVMPRQKPNELLRKVVGERGFESATLEATAGRLS